MEREFAAWWNKAYISLSPLLLFLTYLQTKPKVYMVHCIGWK